MTDTWLKILRQNIKQKGPKQVCKELDYSRATINRCINNKYEKPGAVAARVMAIYGNNGKVPCPVLGEITPQKCADHYGHAKAVGLKVGNPDTMRLHKACMECPVRGGTHVDS